MTSRDSIIFLTENQTNANDIKKSEEIATVNHANEELIDQIHGEWHQKLP